MEYPSEEVNFGEKGKREIVFCLEIECYFSMPFIQRTISIDLLPAALVHLCILFLSLEKWRKETQTLFYDVEDFIFAQNSRKHTSGGYLTMAQEVVDGTWV